MTLSLMNAALLIAAVLVLVPMLVFGCEILLSLLPRRLTGRARTQPGAVSASSATNSSPRTVVLIPAHNEQAVIARTIQCLMPTLPHNASVLVVADNCTDMTAEVAADCGAKVIAREHATRRGKGFALDYGLRFLDSNPPDVVVFIDADTLVEPRTIAALASQAHASQRPQQGVYLCVTGENDGPGQMLSALGMRFRNLIRATGLHNAGLPSHLFGSGMAVPWKLLQRINLASGNIVEDLQMGIDLAIAGFAPQTCLAATCKSPMPNKTAALNTQKTRWIQGHIRSLLTQSPRLLWQSIRQGRFELASMAIDLCIPPLSLLVYLWLAALVVTGTAAACGASVVPAVLMSLGGAWMATCGLIAWWAWCRDVLPAAQLRHVPVYIAGKFGIYARYMKNGAETRWVRTGRDPVSAA